MKKAFLGIAFATPGFFAVAAPLQIPTNVPIVEVAQQTSTYNYVPVNENNSTIKRVVPITDALVTGQSVSDVEPKVSTTRRLPVGTGADVTAKVTIPKNNVAKALVSTAKGVGKLALPGVAALALDALLDYGLKNIKVGSDGSLQADAEPQLNYPVFDGWEYGDDSYGWSLDLVSGCRLGLQSKYGSSFVIGSVTAKNASACDFQYKRPSESNWSDFYINVSRKSSKECTVGWYIANGICTQAKPVTQMSEQEIQDWIASRDGWPTSSAVALAAMLQYPDTRRIIQDYPSNGVEINGPASVKGKSTTVTEGVQLVPGTTTVAPPGTTTATQPGTKTTTTTATHPLTYSGSSVSNSTVNNTTTNITNNVTNVTTSETKTEEIEDDKEEQMPVDSPLGDVPKLYEKQYPEGMSGVWNTKKGEFAQTSFFALIEQLTPKVGQAGSCPSWSIDLSWTPGGSMGVHQLQPPCMIWPILKLIVIISALFLARALIFGG